MNKNDEKKKNGGQKYSTLPGNLHIQNCHFSSQMLLIRFNFQNNHRNANSGKSYYNPQSGQQNRNDTIFRGSYQSCSIKKVLLNILQNSQESSFVRVYFLIKLGLQLY